MITLCKLYNRKAAAALVAIAGLSVFLYGALLLGTVAHAAQLSRAEHTLQQLSGKLSETESRFLTLTKALSPERAASLGFVEPTEVVSVVVGADSLTLR